MPRFTLNGKDVTVDAPAETPLLWVLRDSLSLTGTKFGCGVGQCGACTVHIDGVAQASCQIPVSTVEGKTVLTIEGLSPDGKHRVQEAWIAEQVPQCGYCQPGQIMQAAALLNDKPKPTDAEINDAITNICRCGTFQQVREAIHAAAKA